MVRRRCDPADARRLLNPGPVALVTASFRGEENVVPVAWHTSLSMEPPIVGIVLQSDRHTADMVRHSEQFAISIPGPDLVKAVAFTGSISGADFPNKLEAANLETFPGLWGDAPLVAGCLAWLECGIEFAQRYGDHELFAARVEVVQALDEAYAGRWLLEDREHSPLTYLGGEKYAVVREELDGSFQTNYQGGLVAESAEEREMREEQEAQRREEEQREGHEGFMDRYRPSREPSQPPPQQEQPDEEEPRRRLF